MGVIERGRCSSPGCENRAEWAVLAPDDSIFAYSCAEHSTGFPLSTLRDVKGMKPPAYVDEGIPIPA